MLQQPTCLVIINGTIQFTNVGIFYQYEAMIEYNYLVYPFPANMLKKFYGFISMLISLDILTLFQPTWGSDHKLGLN